MGKLENDLPKIIKDALHKEDKATRGLVTTLLHQVIINQNKASKETIIKKALDDEIDKYISTGLIDGSVLEEC